MTSDAFQEFGKVEVAKEQLMMSVKGPRITGRQSLMMRMLTLSGPGDLLEGIDDTIRSTCVQVTGVKLNSSSEEFLVIGVEIRLVSEILMLLSMANCTTCTYRPCRKNSWPKGYDYILYIILILLPEPIASGARIIHDFSVQLQHLANHSDLILLNRI